MKKVIARVIPGSIAEEMEIESGDALISINNKPVNDILDYKFMMADDYIDVEIEKINGDVWDMEIDKEFGEDIGLEFQDAIMDKAKSCRNNCIFCFIDQLPKGLRSSLYFKDDDSRLAFLQGNFVTLTNLSDEDLDRIIEYKISPINISVHTTNPELRIKMLNNRFAGNILERIKKLAEGGIKMNCQIVLCPGINSGKELLKTAEDLYNLYPQVMNLAAVPVGITKFREGLFDLKMYNTETASAELDNVKVFQEKCIAAIGEPFLRLSDEFYVLAGRDVPESSFYGSYDQLEDGIGMIRYFRDNIRRSIKDLKPFYKKSYTIITGVSAYEEICSACRTIEASSNIKINAVKIFNMFLGETITVAGLVCGSDIISQLKEDKLGDYIIIPKNMLRSGDTVFIDDVSIQDIEKHFDRKVVVCDYTGEDLIYSVNKYDEEEL